MKTTIKRLNDKSVKRFARTAKAMADTASTMDQLERLYNSGKKYSAFIGDRMGTGFYSDQRYTEMLNLCIELNDINSRVESNIKRVQNLTAH